MASLPSLLAQPPAPVGPPPPALRPPAHQPGVRPASNPKVDSLVAQLASADWRAREAAALELRTLGPTILTDLTHRLRSSQDAEVRARITDVARDLFWRHEAGFLGVAMPMFDSGGEGGVRISDVLAGTAADRAGLQADDVIIEFDGHSLVDVSDPADFSKFVLARGQGLPTRLRYRREGEVKSVTTILGPLPPDQIRKRIDSVEPADREAFELWWSGVQRRLPTAPPNPPPPAEAAANPVHDPGLPR